MGVYDIAIRFAVIPALAVAVVLTGALPAHSTAADGIVSTGGGPLNARSGPATDQKIVDTVDNGAETTVICKVRGEHIDGHVRSSATWLGIGADRWISHAYLDLSDEDTDLPWCSADAQKATYAKVAAGGADLDVSADAVSALRGAYRDGVTVQVACQVWGRSVGGEAADANLWYRVADERHVSAAHITWTEGEPWLPWCEQDPPSIPSGGEQGFIDQHAPAAEDSRDATGVPASVTLAQAILETGWGQGALAREDHNMFGMKCFGSPGEHAIGCRDYGTFECSPAGGCFDVDATFRAYAGIADSYRDHGELLSGRSHYATAMEHKDDPDRFAREIHKAGYATDPQYADKLIELMENFDLYRYDN